MIALTLVIAICAVTMGLAVRDGVYSARGMIVSFMVMISLYQPLVAIGPYGHRFLYANVWFAAVLAVLVWITIRAGYLFALRTVHMVTLYMAFALASLYAMSLVAFVPDPTIQSALTVETPPHIFAIWSGYVLASGAAIGVATITEKFSVPARFALSLTAGHLLFEFVLFLSFFAGFPVRLSVMGAALILKLALSMPFAAITVLFGETISSQQGRASLKEPAGSSARNRG